MTRNPLSQAPLAKRSGTSWDTTARRWLVVGDARRVSSSYFHLVLKHIPREGHCRRRKIRCIPSASDIHGRCVNCIRLKKECTFHPVDQSPSAHDRPQPLSRASTGPQSSSASSSPAPHHGKSPPLAPMAPNQGQPYPSATMPKSRHAEQMSGTMAPGVAATFAQRAPGKTQCHLYESLDTDCEAIQDPSNAGVASRQDQVHWTGPDARQGSLGGPVGVNGQWRSFSAHASSFPPYTSQSAPSGWDSHGPENTRPDTLGWAPYAPAHPRSVSRSEGDPGSQHFQHTGQHSRPLTRNIPDQVSPDMYQASMPASYPGAGNESAGAMAHGGSFTTPPAPPSNVDYWQQYPYMRVNDEYADWSYPYSEMNSSMRSEN